MPLRVDCSESVIGMWQEVVAVAVVTKVGCARVGIAQLQQHVAATLHPAKWPQAVVYMDK